MMYRHARLSLTRALTLVSSLTTAGCATVSIATDFDRSADFTHYRTFSSVGGHLVVHGVADDGNTLLKNRIQNAIASALSEKGLSQNADNPDLLVGYWAGARTRSELEGMGPYDPGIGPFWGAGGYWWGTAYGDWWIRRYEEGTLVIDLVDAHSKGLVWRAYARAEVNPPVTDEKVRDAVYKAFQHYPPGR
jgi:hypothetical protein